MKIRITSFNAVVIAASMIVLILCTNAGAATLSPQADRAAAIVAGSESNVNAGNDFIRSLTTTTSVALGVYDLSFWVYRNGALEPVSSLPVRGGPLVLFAHVEDINGNPAPSGEVTFEYCGDYEPKEICDVGLARWTRQNRMSIGACYCRSCGGLQGYDPGPGNACLFVTSTGGTPGDDGFRYRYAGSRRSGVDSGMSGSANFTWTP